MRGVNIECSHVLDEMIGTADILELSETDLGNDSTKLTTGSRDTVRSGTITSGENFTGDNERGGVGAEVLEEVGETVLEENKGLGGGGVLRESVVTETKDAEEDSEDNEFHELDGLATPAVNREEGGPITGDETGDDEDQVADRDVLEVLVDTDGLLGNGSVG